MSKQFIKNTFNWFSYALEMGYAEKQACFYALKQMYIL